MRGDHFSLRESQGTLPGGEDKFRHLEKQEWRKLRAVFIPKKPLMNADERKSRPRKTPRNYTPPGPDPSVFSKVRLDPGRCRSLARTKVESVPFDFSWANAVESSTVTIHFNREQRKWTPMELTRDSSTAQQR
jgi:hypothetical protein